MKNKLPFLIILLSIIIGCNTKLEKVEDINNISKDSHEEINRQDPIRNKDFQIKNHKVLNDISIKRQQRCTMKLL